MNGSVDPPIPGITIPKTFSGDSENIPCTEYGTASFQPTGCGALTHRFARCPYSRAGKSCNAAVRNRIAAATPAYRVSFQDRNRARYHTHVNPAAIEIN